MTRRPSAGDEQSRRSRRSARTCQPAKLVGEERGDVEASPGGVRLQPMTPTRAPVVTPSVAEDLRQRLRAVARLARQAEVLEEWRRIGRGADNGIRSTLCRRGSPVPVAATISTASSNAGRKRPGTQVALCSRSAYTTRRWYRAGPCGLAVGRDAPRGGTRIVRASSSGDRSPGGSPRPDGHARHRHPRLLMGDSGCAAVAPRSIRRTWSHLDLEPRPDLAVRPRDADLGARRVTQAEMDGHELAAGVPARS